MHKYLGRDQELVRAAQEYFNSGNSELFIKEVWEWARDLAQKKYQMDEDSSSEVVLSLVQRADRCLDIFKEGKYNNLGAFLNVYIKHLIWNQRKKSSQQKILYIDKFPEFGYVPEFESRIVEEDDRIILLIHDLLTELEMGYSIVVKLRHHIRMNLKELRYLYRIPGNSIQSIRTQFKKNELERQSVRIQRRKILDRIQSLNAKITGTNLLKIDSLKISKLEMGRKLERKNQDLSFRKVANLLRSNENAVRKVYFDAIRILKSKLAQEKTFVRKAA
ncbi:hypothetical protein [Leptospira perolatii]|uniref:RNA polymerase subunit sigma-70 n=1 Tax=Leptospira perolatii TaxID=2023191 RepID=A0ABX4P7N7_9LEPT|nr:hypothetical protein [Leptospira perolatii]PJZ68955.1 hypothetical protein CH360_13870 [Leptospira perolatii]